MEFPLDIWLFLILFESSAEPTLSLSLNNKLILTFRIINSSGESDRFFEFEPARPADKLAGMNP